MWRSEESLRDQDLSFYNVGSQGQSQVIRLGRKHFYPPNHLADPDCENFGFPNKAKKSKDIINFSTVTKSVALIFFLVTFKTIDVQMCGTMEVKDNFWECPLSPNGS